MAFVREYVGPREVDFSWRRGDREVRIALESFVPPSIEIRPSAVSERFFLHEAMEACGQAAAPGVWNDASADTCLKPYASFFHAHGDALLGDYRRLWDGVRRLRASLSDAKTEGRVPRALDE